MDKRLQNYVGSTIFFVGVAFCGIAAALWTPFATASAALGVAFSLINWFVLCLLTRRIVSSKGDARVTFSVLLSLKMAVFLGVAATLVLTRAVDALGFALGLVSLGIGIMVGGLLAKMGIPLTQRG